MLSNQVPDIDVHQTRWLPTDPASRIRKIDYCSGFNLKSLIQNPHIHAPENRQKVDPRGRRPSSNLRSIMRNISQRYQTIEEPGSVNYSSAPKRSRSIDSELSRALESVNKLGRVRTVSSALKVPLFPCEPVMLGKIMHNEVPALHALVMKRLL